MSLVYISFHNENIHDIEKPRFEEENNYKFPKYVSVNRKIIKNSPLNETEQQGKKLISASKKFSHKTWGYAETPLDDPSNYLKKNGGIKWQRLNDHVCPPSKGLPPIPKKEDIRKSGGFNHVNNCIKENINRIKTAVPQRLRPRYVDTAVGDRHDLNGTGLILEHVLSKKYGKPPAYLENIKKALKENVCDKTSQEVSESVKILSDADRNAILMGLRENHAEFERTYQLLPIFTDTHSKKQRKTKLEQELKRLEQDILLLESNPVILVCEN